MATIEETTKRGLCVSCGSCKAVCPTEAITYLFQDGIFVPSINKEKCINCSKCFEVCPGIEVNYTYLHKKYSDKIPSDFFKGNSIASYIVVTKNENILLNSSSGGFITSLIESLLAKKEYDSAFLLKYDDFDGLPAFLERVTDHKKVKDESGGDEILVQEYIDGNPYTYGCGVLFLGGEPVEIYCHEELLSVPRTGGSGTKLRLYENEELKRMSLALLSELNWNGIALVEFKKRKDGTFVLMEINPKFWASYPLASKYGYRFASHMVSESLNIEFTHHNKKKQKRNDDIPH